MPHHVAACAAFAFACVLAVAPAAAQEGFDSPAARAVRAMLPDAKIESVSSSAIDGVDEVVVSGNRVFYVSRDGAYLVQGTMLRVADRSDLTEAARADVRARVLLAADRAQRIRFAPADPKHTVTVFTSVDCGFCVRLHGQIAAYNALGIAVEYVLISRSGRQSEAHRIAERVWCADDPRQALTAAKAGQPVPERRCDTPLEASYALASAVGVASTPAIIAADGTLIGGYLTPEAMRKKLDALAAR